MFPYGVVASTFSYTCCLISRGSLVNDTVRLLVVVGGMLTYGCSIAERSCTRKRRLYISAKVPRCDELKLNPSRLDRCFEKAAIDRNSRGDAEMFHDINNDDPKDTVISLLEFGKSTGRSYCLKKAGDEKGSCSIDGRVR